MAVKGSKIGNKFVFESDCVKMMLRRRTGDPMYTIIDKEDYEKVRDFPFTWHAAYDIRLENYFYCSAVTYFKGEDGKTHQSSVSLHSFLTGTNGRKDVRADHINRDALDNRRKNLRVTDAASNAKNRNGPNRNNESGYRNVFWNTSEEKWQITLCKNGKRIIGGFYDDVDEAGREAEKLRHQHYGEYAGANQRA